MDEKGQNLVDKGIRGPTLWLTEDTIIPTTFRSLPPPLLHANANPKPHHSWRLLCLKTSGDRNFPSRTSGDRSGNSSFSLRLNFGTVGFPSPDSASGVERVGEVTLRVLCSDFSEFFFAAE
ncbi:hypothetical protein E2542_SST13513 [Spatholobus suberectus]|nr:hypothetical protein E2542_SST13513 [Spatholobus suberectus]